MHEKIKNVILATFVADAYALGPHWIYDEIKLQNLPINWSDLNDPQVIWHKGKERGDLTHYGDQLFYLLEYIARDQEFDVENYYRFWSEYMSDYDGYIDAATRNALKKRGSESNDLSICSRIAPLLFVSNTREAFLENVQKFVSITHNTPLAIEASLFFAELLWDSLENPNISENIDALKENYPKLRNWINEGVESQYENTVTTLKKFGTACGINDGFAGVIHLLMSKGNFQTVLQRNNKAGGDSAARGKAYAMIMATKDDFTLPKEWMGDIKLMNDIESALGKK